MNSAPARRWRSAITISRGTSRTWRSAGCAKPSDDKLLREYVQYWQAQASLALGQKEAALEQLQSILRDFPDSVMTEQAVTSLAQTALAIGKSEDALAALDAYPNTSAKPALLLLRAQAREKIARGERRKSPLPRPRIISTSTTAFR